MVKLSGIPICSLLLLTAMVSSLRVRREAQAPMYHAANAKDRVKNEYIVKLKDDLTQKELNKLHEHFAKISKEKGVKIDLHKNIETVMKAFTAELSEAAVEELRWLDEVDFVEEDEEFELDYTLPIGLDRIDQDELPLDGQYKSIYGNGAGVNVFVMDTGILFGHNQFGGRALPFTDEIDDGQNGSDCHGHGTHVAGIIGGYSVGVANEVTLYSARTFDCNGGQGTAARLIAAIDAIGAANMPNSLLSISISGGRNIAVNEALDRLSSTTGIIIIAAAGNKARSACYHTPPSAQSVITVGATTEDDVFASYSNYGRCVDILAPGSGIYSAHSSSNNAYTTKSGTSMACPHVTGAAAILRSINSSYTVDDIRSILLESAGKNLVDMSVIPEERRAATPNLLLRLPEPWRKDGLCGSNNPNVLGDVGQCDWYGDSACCRDGHICASCLDGCTTDCTDYTKICENTCYWSYDDYCDDGGPDSEYDLCEYGTDCGDCGDRPARK